MAATKHTVKPVDNPFVHRDINLVSPHQRGLDVQRIQEHIHQGFIDHKVDWIHIEVDGVMGPQTARAAAFYCWFMGIENKYRKNIRQGHISEYSQQWIRGTLRHSRSDKRRQKLRQPKLKKIREKQHSGAQAAVTWALQQVGTTEVPAESNTGPKIAVWEKYWGLGPCYWCGVFAGYAVKAIGKALVTSQLTYGPYIINDARNHANGLAAISPDNAQPGDLVVYWNGEHIGLIRAVSRNGYVITVEGNTSSSDGSQSNGGVVALKERPFSDVTVVARPHY